MGMGFSSSPFSWYGDTMGVRIPWSGNAISEGEVYEMQARGFIVMSIYSRALLLGLGDIKL